MRLHQNGHPSSPPPSIAHSIACELGRPYHHREQSTSVQCGTLGGPLGTSFGAVSQNQGRLHAARHLASCRAPSAGWSGRTSGAADEPVPPRGSAGLPGAMSTHWSGCAPAGRCSAPCMLLRPCRPLPLPLPPPPQHGGGAGPGQTEERREKATRAPPHAVPYGSARGFRAAPPRGTQRGARGAEVAASPSLSPPSCLRRMVRAAAGRADGGRAAPSRHPVRLLVLGCVLST